jgi:hypothetical protein
LRPGRAAIAFPLKGVGRGAPIQRIDRPALPFYCFDLLMNIVKATKMFEEWLGHHARVISPALRLKHERMAESLFLFLRATFYRWVQVWPEVVSSEFRYVPHILAVGDLHVQNFGTWRDVDGRLVWGVNDFDEASLYPYTMDLVRLLSSGLAAAREHRLAMKPKEAAGAILEGYERGLREGGRPFVLSEENGWLRSIAESKRDPVTFWQKIDQLPTLRSAVPESARDAFEHMLPEPGLRYRVARRVAGLGSLGRTRLVAIANWKGGRVAREAKALVPSSLHWFKPQSTPGEVLYSAILRRAVRCPDPYVQLRGHWIVRRLSPDCSRIQLEALRNAREELRLLGAMGRETANIHLGTEEKRRAILKDLRKRKGNWLLDAAQAMLAAGAKDWKVWRERWQS